MCSQRVTRPQLRNASALHACDRHPTMRPALLRSAAQVAASLGRSGYIPTLPNTPTAGCPRGSHGEREPTNGCGWRRRNQGEKHRWVFDRRWGIFVPFECVVTGQPVAELLESRARWRARAKRGTRARGTFFTSAGGGTPQIWMHKKHTTKRCRAPKNHTFCFPGPPCRCHRASAAAPDSVYNMEED